MKFSLWLFIVFSFLHSEAEAQIRVTATAGNTGPVVYPTIKEAFDAVNLGVHTADVSMEVIGNCIESSSAILNASGAGAAIYTGINIYVSPGLSASISGNINGPLIDLNGSDMITLDGYSTGGNLLIDNTSNTISAATIRFIGDASGNQIQNCTIKGAGSSATTGIIFFSTGTTTGNDSNTISHNTITSSAPNFALHAIYASGSSATIANDENVIHNNKISDYYHPTIPFKGIQLASTGNTAWTITDNRLYQTAIRYFYVSTSFALVAINIEGGDNYILSGNIIGYENDLGTGTTKIIGSQPTDSLRVTGVFPGSYTLTGTSTTVQFVGIRCSFKAGGIYSSIQNNTLAGFAILTSSNNSANSGIWCGIQISAGNADIGTVTGNIIGSISGNTSIYTACTNSGGTVVGIYAITSNMVTIQNNIIGDIDAVGTSATLAGGFRGIEGGGSGGVLNISSNTIGNSTIDNIRTGYTLLGGSLSNDGALVYTTGTVASIVGIRNSATGSTSTMHSNTLQGWSTSGNVTAVSGIHNSNAISGSVSIQSNSLGTAVAGWIQFPFVHGAGLTGISISGSHLASSYSIQYNDFEGITYVAESPSGNTYISMTTTNFTGSTVNINYNTFTNLDLNVRGGIKFISHNFSMSATGKTTINYNSIVGSFTNVGDADDLMITYSNGGSQAGSVCSISNNNFSNLILSGSTEVYGFLNYDGFAPAKTVVNNVLDNWTGGTGPVLVMYFSKINGSLSRFSNNTITNITGQNSITGIEIVHVWDGPGIVNIDSNTISNLISTGAGNFVYGIRFGNLTDLANIRSNLIHGLSSTGASALISGINVYLSDSVIVSKNVIYNITGSGTSLPVVNGISVVGGTGVTILSHNKIYSLAQTDNISASTVSGVNGIFISGGNSVKVLNNLIGELWAPAANLSQAIHGISITSTVIGSIYRIYNNTIHINATSTGTNFGTAGIFHIGQTSSTRNTLDLRNNIIVNTSTAAGTGYTVVLRRSNLNFQNHHLSSNNNCFYAGTPSTPNFIYYNGTTGYQMAAYQAHVAPRDSASISEAPVFLSMSGASSNFLHIEPNSSTAIEDGGLPLSIVTNDFDLDFRDEISPDIGADEFSFCTPFVVNLFDSGEGSFRDVIACAANGATITFSNSLSGQSIILTSGEIEILKNVKVFGLGINNLTISGNNNSRIFHVHPGKTLELRDVSLINCTSSVNGGAAFVEGTLFLQNIRMENNFENGVPKSLTLSNLALLKILASVELKI